MNLANKFKVIGECQISKSATICDGAIIGKPYRRFLDGSQEVIEKTIIAKDTYIGYYAIVGTGSIIGPNSIIDDFCIIESRVHIESNCLLIYKAQICNDVIIGSNSIIGGFVGERTIIGKNCRIFGKIIHAQNDPTLGWDDDEAMEPSSIINDNVFIGFNAIVVGDVKIASNVYICAGTIVTRDVPANHIVCGLNKIIHFSQWKGYLSKSLFFKNG